MRSRLPPYDPWTGIYLGAVTYGQLDLALQSLGFEVHKPEPGTKVYLHRPSKATLVFAAFSARKRLMDHHLEVTRMVIGDFGVAGPEELSRHLQAASQSKSRDSVSSSAKKPNPRQTPPKRVAKKRP